MCKTDVFNATLGTAMIQPKHRFQGRRKDLNTSECVGLQSVVLNYLVCGCNVIARLVGVACLGNTSRSAVDICILLEI